MTVWHVIWDMPTMSVKWIRVVSDGQICTITGLLMIKICEVICISHNIQVQYMQDTRVFLFMYTHVCVLLYIHLNKLAGTWNHSGMFKGTNLIVMPDKSCFSVCQSKIKTRTNNTEKDPIETCDCMVKSIPRVKRLHCGPQRHWCTVRDVKKIFLLLPYNAFSP